MEPVISWEVRMSAFGKRGSTIERRQGDRRRGGEERRKKVRRKAEAAPQAVIYREWSDTLRDIAETDRHAERQRTLLKLAADYARLAAMLHREDAIATSSAGRDE